MARSRIFTSAACAAAAIVSLGACGGSLTEFVTEQAIEASSEEDVDFDLDGDGGFTITSEEGTFTFDVDGEDGSFSFDGEDGTESFDLDVDEDGSTTITSSDGSTSSFGGSQIPDDWPSIIGVPATMDPEETFYLSTVAEGQQRSRTATFSHDENDPYAQEVVDRLLAAGYQVEYESSTPQGSNTSLNNGTEMVTVLWSPGSTIVGIVSPA